MISSSRALPREENSSYVKPQTSDEKSRETMSVALKFELPPEASTHTLNWAWVQTAERDGKRGFFNDNMAMAADVKYPFCGYVVVVHNAQRRDGSVQMSKGTLLANCLMG